MKAKYILEIYDENSDLVSSVSCKSYREIANITDQEYHDCRAMHLIGNGSMKRKFLHPTLKKLMLKIKILDI